MHRMEWTNSLVLLCCLCLGVPTLGTPISTSDTSQTKKSAETLRREKRSFEDTSMPKWKIYYENYKYIVPYEVVDQTGVDHTQQVLEAFEDYHHFTCIRFRPRSNEEEYLTITLEELDAHIYCGFANPTEKSVNVNVNCGHLLFTLRHELYHAIGFHHEFQRPDAGEYINFKIAIAPSNDEGKKTLDLTPFDIYSISMYEDFRSKETDTLFGKGYGRLSYFDIKNINHVYRCRQTLFYFGCSGSTLPTVIGGGRLSSNKSVYEHMEGVRIICDDGYEVIETQFSYCENSTFSPAQLECRRIPCEDDEFTDCDNLVQNGICTSADTMEKRSCQRSCGFCDSRCYLTPSIKQFGYIANPPYLKQFYFPNETLTFKCPYGYLPITKDHATCMGASGWDVEEFQCTKNLDPNSYDYDLNTAVSANKCKIEELPNTDHGKYVPYKELYDREDVVQLVCDHGYEPVSSSTAYCTVFYVDNVPTLKFDFTHLQCVKKTCYNQRYYDLLCEMRKFLGECNHPKHIGRMRKYCKKSCQFCDSCKSTPIFDRSVSYLTPMKTEYQTNENVTITCINGYHAVNTATAECRGGEFNPPQLMCEADTTSCSLPSISGARSILPMLQVYPSGYEIAVECISTNPYNPLLSIHEGRPKKVYEQIRCVDGRFQDFTCPPEKLCTASQLEVFTNNVCNITSDDPISYKPSHVDADRPLDFEPKKAAYGEADNFVKVFCNEEAVKLVACVDGEWVTNENFYPPDLVSKTQHGITGKKIKTEAEIAEYVALNAEYGEETYWEDYYNKPSNSTEDPTNF